MRKTLWAAVAILLVLTAGMLFVQTDAVAQLRAALVKNVDEPARTPYEFSVQPTKPFGNVYYADFPPIPAGKRLKLTRISGHIRGVSASNSGAFVSVNDPGSSLSPRLSYPLAINGNAYYGLVYTFNIEVDYIFEAGQSPRVEVGVNAGTGGLPDLFTDWQRIRAHGYLVDLSL